ncbi:hypothetical protein F5Y19DRAFT_328236 [Xylariaceae sp. FL1651]|nr:hypothetical protein F5Y19DRAFT_328236 [Xylariaceae sp. FL1651]
MVSFFGLKIGGEKKKKSTKDIQISAPQPRNIDNSNVVDSDYFDFEGGPKAAYAASVYSLSRPDSAQSGKLKKAKLKGLKIIPFAPGKDNPSMIDLPSPHKLTDSSYSSLRHHVSNPSLGRQWNSGSSTSLSFAPPPSINPMARPSTSDGKSKNWVNPLDVHFTRESSATAFTAPLSAPLPTHSIQSAGNLPSIVPKGPPSAPSSAVPKSPLGQYELKLDLPSDVSTFFADLDNFDGAVKAPAPLRIKKQASSRTPPVPRKRSQSPRKPPTPPQSINDNPYVTDSPEHDLPKPSVADNRPSSARSNCSIPSGLQELQNAISNFGPASLPSPSTTPRASEEKPPSAVNTHRAASPPTQKVENEPVIQNVQAKRDTLTINPERRRSLQMKIEAADGSNILSLPLAERPKTSNDRRPFERPPPLNLNFGLRLSVTDRDGPRSAPFLRNPARSLTPVSVISPLRSQIGAMGTHGRTTHSALSAEIHELRSGLDSPTGSSIYDDDEDDRPLSPESPVIPLTGPLASPRFPPLESPYSHHPHPSTFVFPRKEDTDSNRSLSPAFIFPPPRSLNRNPPTPDSSDWPLPSPVAPSFDRAAAASPSSSGESRLRSESLLHDESESGSIYEPLEPPRLPAARSGAESPTFRSFSRPWTPTLAAPDFKVPGLKRAETAGLPASTRSGSRAPPRSATVKTPKAERGIITAAAVDSDEADGSGFI